MKLPTMAKMPTQNDMSLFLAGRRDATDFKLPLKNPPEFYQQGYYAVVKRFGFTGMPTATQMRDFLRGRDAVNAGQQPDPQQPNCYQLGYLSGSKQRSNTSLDKLASAWGLE